ncbi:hypothetical protein ACWGRV_38585 [Streptomyces sp. NPDC055663]
MAGPAGNKAFTLLSAIVDGDASIQDSVAELERYGIESTGDLLSTLSEGFRTAQNAGEELNFDNIPEETPQDLVKAIVQRAPQVPFILNGTMYDPEDIVRFNGQELHFVASLTGDHMLAVDDRQLYARWRQVTRLEQYLQNQRFLPRVDDASTSDTLLGPPNPLTGFYEDINLEGHLFNVKRNWGRTRLGGDNDEISSFMMVGTQVTELFEHVDYMGQTWSKILPYSPTGDYYHEERNLHQYGWGDRVSSLGTW